jgi:hypothetical protein
MASAAAVPSVSTLIRSAATSIAADYRRDDLGSIRRLITDPHIAASLDQRLRRWKNEHVQDLHVTAVYQKTIGRGRYVATLRFASDPRAVPWYGIYLLQISGQRVRIVGTTSGITGNTIQTANWSVTRTAHFVIYHSPYQLAGADRETARDLEYERARFVAKFGVNVPRIAVIYLFPDEATMGRLTQGQCGRQAGEVGCTLPFAQPPTIFATMQALYHEPIHVFEVGMTPHQVQRGNHVITYYAPLFIGEGTAVALEDRSADPSLSDYCSDLRYLPLDVCARIAINHMNPLNILSDKGFGKVNPDYTYSLSGSFVKYLLLHYGYRPFAKFYYRFAAQPGDSMADYDVAARSVYHTSVRVLLRRWTDTLCAGGC